MSDQEVNENIAEMLGFKKYRIINGPVAWVYPNDWKDEVKASPMTSIPNFFKMLQQVRDISDTFNYGIPHQQLDQNKEKDFSVTYKELNNDE